MVGTGCKDTLVICNSTFIALVSLQPVPSLVKIVFGYTRQRLSFLMFLKIRKLAFQI
jgi:hypothetical protein